MPTYLEPDDVSRIKASGAVLWRLGPGGAKDLELALIHRPRYDDWSFAKGKAEPGEHAVLTAVREVEEETAHRVVLGRRLPGTDYEVLGRPKRVKYWAARVVEEGRFAANDEVDELEWLPAEQARERLTSALDVEVLDAFLAGPADTFPIVLQRHGKAERRSSLYADDLARPLAPAGRQQAIALAELLAVYGAEELISSPAVRCVGTVQPYADLHGVEMHLESALTEISYVHAPRAVVSWLADLAARRVGAIACTHGPLLDELIAAVLYGPGFADPEQEPTLNGQPWSAELADRWANDPLPTGAAWVLHFAADDGDSRSPRLVAVDRLKS
ncbi:MAG TPA: NUDIX hydrolase [Actinospica sp.]|jgi:8-oxo-dGTP diphosphatase|nr:NUDIX hydrolase [Actinospica sp.]